MSTSTGATLRLANLGGVAFGLVFLVVMACADEVTPSTTDPVPTTVSVPTPSTLGVTTTTNSNLSSSQLPPVHHVAFQSLDLPGDAPHLFFMDGVLWVPGFDEEAGRSYVTKVDPATLTVVEEIGLPSAPWDLAYAFDSFWVSDFDASVVYRVGLEGNVIAEIAVGANPEGIVATPDAIWVANHRGGSLSVIDPTTNSLASTVVLGPEGRRGPMGGELIGDLLWVPVPNRFAVVAVDTTTLEIVDEVTIRDPAVPCGSILRTGDLLWVTSCLDTRYMALVDLSTDEMEAVFLAGFGGELVQVGDVVYLPVSSSSTSYIWAFDLEGTPLARFEMPRGADIYAAKVAYNSLWTNDGRRGIVYRIPLEELSTG